YQAQFEGARVNLLQLLQSDNAVFNTKLGLMNSEYRLVASRFAVLASMGRLQEALTTLPARADDK
ncbi:MAG: transporter, partial [Alphaproteobacteria bacterium CG_4_9_14_3_um_filter_47_13]